MEKSILLSVCLLAALSFLVACGPTPVDESALAKGGGHRLYRTNGPGAGLYPYADGDIYANRYPHANVYAYPHTYPYCYTHFHSRADAYPYSHIHFHGRADAHAPAHSHSHADAYASTSPSLRGVEGQNPLQDRSLRPGGDVGYGP